MELKAPSESEAVSLPDCPSDAEEQEFSDDDDRNHKHRKRDTRSQSLERDQTEQFMSRSYRKNGKPFDSGHPSRESDPQSRYNTDREFPSKFGRRLNANQRFKTNQPFSGDFGNGGRGRGRNSGLWNQRDSRFPPIDMASQMAPLGPHPAVFSGRGLHNVPSAQNSPWGGGFGLIPGIPNGAMDPIHSLGLQGTFRPPLNPNLNMSIPRQRCRDFEERGFCLRGDMCLMEHGVNRIVVDDVQSLSQFNLPASLPGGHVLANPGGVGSGPTVNPSSSSSAPMNSKVSSNRASRPGMDDGGYALGGDGIAAADVYDPDQPLWNSEFAHMSTVGEVDPYMEPNPDELVSGNGASIGPQGTTSSNWGRMNSANNKFGSGGRTDSRVNSSKFPDSRDKEKGEAYGKRSNAGELVNSSGRSMRKPFQKALRTLFVSNVPLKDNKKEALYSHFKKFGEVIDIHTPPNSELAFVQFSKKEEAERALKSPDAVMGNRFIKLLWANRDNIAEDNIVGGKTIHGVQRHMPEASDPPHVINANASKENVQRPKPPATNGSKLVTEPPGKKKENLELLKEELRKKQEMLERKRNEFRLQLDKLQKHATGTRDEVPEERAAKKLKIEGEHESPKLSNPGASASDLPAEGSMNKSQQVENVNHSIKTKFSSPMLESSNLNHVAHPLNYVGRPFPTNRYKIDNRPTSFRVNAPLPPEFANVNSVREHFAVFGDLSNIELESLEEAQDENSSESATNLSACVRFKTRQAAEKALENGKSWKGHSLKLTWLIPSKPNSIPKEKSPASRNSSSTELLQPIRKPGSSLSANKGASGTEIQSAPKSVCDVSHDSCGGSQTSEHVLPGLSGAEAQSADKSAEKQEEASPVLAAVEKDREMELFDLNEDPASGEKQEDDC